MSRYLLDCHEDVQKAIEAGRIGISHGKTLSALPREEQVAALEPRWIAPARSRYHDR